jgi:MFS family permease
MEVSRTQDWYLPRAVQGAGAALLLPGSIAVIVDAYPEPAQRARSLDLGGLISAVVTLAALVFAVITAGRSGLSPSVLVAIAVVLLAATGFVEVERRARDPLLPLSLLWMPALPPTRCREDADHPATLVRKHRVHQRPRAS